MRPDEWRAVAALIHDSTNAWYRKHRGFDIFTAGPEACLLFCETYEALDPGHCLVAQDPASGRLMGSCFYHPRETHVSLGIMNVHPDFFGRGVARALLRAITDVANERRLPTRLVSSAMNLDSFSLYSRAGFVPVGSFVDMQFTERRHPGYSARATSDPAETIQRSILGVPFPRVRPATATDVPNIVALETRLAHIRREKDWRYFIENWQGIWHTLVHEDEGGGIDGVLSSVFHPASNMIGPGVMASDEAAAALVAAQLEHHRGRSPVLLAPLDRPGLVQRLYDMGGKNVEIHFGQERPGTAPKATEPATGVVMPTFMPETA
jgi:GNAT superfamily N-acetyltransferase